MLPGSCFTRSLSWELRSMRRSEIVHLVTIIYAVQGGLSAAEIFGRTRGNVAWFIFYSIFVLGVAVHAPIGLRSVFIEWLGWRDKSRDVALLLFSLLLLVMGMRAVL